MTRITVERELEQRGAWSFDVVLLTDSDAPRHHEVRLSWQDYDHWCRGAASPAEVAGAVMRFLIRRIPPSDIAPRFDAGSLRRRFPEIDRELSSLIGDQEDESSWSSSPSRSTSHSKS